MPLGSIGRAIEIQIRRLLGLPVVHIMAVERPGPLKRIEDLATRMSGVEEPELEAIGAPPPPPERLVLPPPGYLMPREKDRIRNY